MTTKSKSYKLTEKESEVLIVLLDEAKRKETQLRYLISKGYLSISVKEFLLDLESTRTAITEKGFYSEFLDTVLMETLDAFRPDKLIHSSSDKIPFEKYLLHIERTINTLTQLDMDNVTGVDDKLKDTSRMQDDLVAMIKRANTKPAPTAKTK